jgi:DNA invertase Pin-like site-specific DNA recombinase
MLTFGHSDYMVLMLLDTWRAGVSHAGVLVGYARTSTTEQRAGLEAQLRELKSTGCAKIFKEQVSSIGERAQLGAALEYVREGDTLVVTKLDRLARSARGLGELVDTLQGKGVALRILNFGGGQVDTRGAAGRLMLNVFAAFAQFELEIMKERQREGIADAKAAGRYKGRKPTARAKASDAVKLFQQGKRVSEVAKSLNIGRASVYRALENAGLRA